MTGSVVRIVVGVNAHSWQYADLFASWGYQQPSFGVVILSFDFFYIRVASWKAAGRSVESKRRSPRVVQKGCIITHWLLYENAA